MPIPRATGRRPAARGGRRRTGISDVGDAGSLILHRCRAAPEIRYGRLSVDWAAGAVSTPAGRILLSKTELRLLGALLDAPRGVITREELSRSIWPEVRASSRGCPALAVYVCSLRRRLASIGAGSALRTRGIAYRLQL